MNLVHLQNAIIVTLVIVLVYLLYKRMIIAFRRGDLKDVYATLIEPVRSEKTLRIRYKFPSPQSARLTLQHLPTNQEWILCEKDFGEGEGELELDLSAYPKGRFQYTLSTRNQKTEQFFEIK